MPRAEGTCLNAGRLQALGDAVITEVAFLCGVINRMEEPDAVRTAHDAVTAPYAPGPVYHDNAVRRLIGRTNRADLDTGGIFALVAELGDKEGLFYVLFLDVLKFA